MKPSFILRLRWILNAPLRLAPRFIAGERAPQECFSETVSTVSRKLRDRRPDGKPLKRFRYFDFIGYPAINRGANGCVLRTVVFIVAIFVLVSGRIAAAPFDGQRAMADVRKQCSFGARIPGTAGHLACRDWIKSQIEEVGLVVWEQPFHTKLPLINGEADAWNLWGVPPALAGGDASKYPAQVIVLSAHWDTRPIADQEPAKSASEKSPPEKSQPEKSQKEPFLGANDGGSGVAVALGIARAIRGTPLEGRVALAFFDAEDSGIQKNMESWCLGSAYAAANPPSWIKRMKLGINLDMVGGKGLKLSKEGFSFESYPKEVNRLWKIGFDLAPSVFVKSDVGSVEDDHRRFIQKGYPFINLIGFPYDQWHKLGDKPEACDARAMTLVAMTLVEFVRQELAPAASAPARKQK